MTEADKPQRITSTDIRMAMSAKFAPPEWAIMWEVGNATGAAQRRWADAVMMSIWPSRGLELHGVEIKVSTADWKREAADPRKAEEVGQFCDRWWVHTSPGVVKDLAEVPPAWGLREWDGKKWSTKREAAKNEKPTPLTRGFLAAMLRRADGDERARIRREAEQLAVDSRKALEDERAAQEARIAAAVERRTKQLQGYADQVKAFEEASGVTLSSLYGDPRAGDIGRLVQVILAAGITGTYGRLLNLRRQLGEMTGRLDTAIDNSGFVPPAPETTVTE